MAKRRRSSRTPFPDRFSSEIIRWTDGDTAKPDPLFILVINNIALERPFGSGRFVRDMGTDTKDDRKHFKATAEYIKKNLFGELPRQAEKLLADSPHCDKIRFWSMYLWGLPSNAATSFVGEFGLTNGFLKPRRAAVVDMRASIGMNPDVVFIVSRISEKEYQRASALGTTDDDQRGGIATTFDGRTIVHRFYHKIPGMVAIHSNSRDMTAAHEFSHAFSSYSNGFITDLYRDNDLYCHGTVLLNRKLGRPIPREFARYNGKTYLSDKHRNGLGYGDFKSYNSELTDRTAPALMDDYWGNPLKARHDKMTKQFVMDRIAAKASR
jgi:hypothetical protein